ncbi:MAG: hypothetical protein ACOX63_10140 [Christensenellales bacterium]|jgi:hypothetical protein
MMQYDIERAIEWFSDEKEYFVNMEGLPFADATESANYRKGRMALDTALTALFEARERVEGCWHCRGIDMVGVKSCTEIDTETIGLYKPPEPTPYNYCPSCGRRLAEDINVPVKLPSNKKPSKDNENAQPETEPSTYKQVTYCRDCVHYAGGIDHLGECTHKKHKLFPVAFDFFCEDGEKATEEGDTCPKCNEGKLKYGPVENCTCHIFPPCSACVDNPLVCDSCGEKFDP